MTTTPLLVMASEVVVHVAIVGIAAAAAAAAAVEECGLPESGP